MNPELFIGWSEADITPPEDGKPIPLYGQYYARNAEGIHSRLKTVAVAMSSGSEAFVEASIDNCGINADFSALVRKAVARQIPELDVSKIFINAIHTHNAPGITVVKHPSKNSWKRVNDNVITPEEYVEFVLPIVAGNIVAAWRNRRPGGIARAYALASIGHCRRAVFANGRAEMYGDTTRDDFIGMEAGEDPGVELLFTFDASGKRTGVLLNVACPSQIMEATRVVSSDFAGATRELLKKTFGKEFCALYQISPAGCQSPRDLVRHPEKPDGWHADMVEMVSRRLAAAVAAAEPGEVDYRPVMRHTVRRVDLPRRRVSVEECRAAEAELERLLAIQDEAAAFKDFCAEELRNEAAGGRGPYDSKLHHFVRIKNEQAVLLRRDNQDQTPEISFDMNVVRLGDVVLANNPFELYLVYGQIIKARSAAAQTFLIQHAVGAYPFAAGYLPSPEAERFGGYGGCVINGQCGHEAGYRLVDITVDEIARLFQE